MKIMFQLLIFIWVIISFFNIFYNGVKSFSEMQEWGTLTDSEKRHKLFGSVYDFIMLIQNHTSKNDRILIYSKDIKTHYLSIYYLYPRVVTTTNDKQMFLQLIKTKKFVHIASYGSPITADNYEKVASLSAKVSDKYGFLYKLK